MFGCKQMSGVLKSGDLQKIVSSNLTIYQFKKTDLQMRIIPEPELFFVLNHSITTTGCLSRRQADKVKKVGKPVKFVCDSRKCVQAL